MSAYTKVGDISVAEDRKCAGDAQDSVLVRDESGVSNTWADSPAIHLAHTLEGSLRSPD